MQYSFTALLFSPLLFSTFDYNGCDAAMLCRTCWYGGSGGPSSGGRVTRSLCSTALAGPSSLTLLTHCAAPGMTCWPGMSCPSLPMPFSAFALHCLCPLLPVPFTAFALHRFCPSLPLPFLAALVTFEMQRSNPCKRICRRRVLLLSHCR